MLIKTVLAEMTPMLDVLVHDLYGHKVLLHIVRPGDTKYFHPMGKASPTGKIQPCVAYHPTTHAHAPNHLTTN